MKHLVFTLLLLGVAFMASAQHNPVAHPEATVTLGNARFTVLTPQMIRLEWNETGAFVDAATFVAVNRRMPVPEFSTSNEGGEFVLETSELTLTYTGQGAKFTPENTSISFTLNGQSTQWVPGLEDPENLRGTSRTLDGMTGGNDWNGNPIELEPGILSRNGWALIDDSGNFQFDGSDWQWVQAPAEGAQQDWYFLGYGHKYTDALRDYTRMAGSIPMLPRYALGYWWSRYWVYSDPELRQLMQEMRSYGIPIDVLIIDMDWHETFGGLQDIRNPQLDETGHKLGWTGYTWNRNLFPEPERFLQWTEDYHLKTALNLHPASGIAPGEDQYQAFAKRIGFDASSGKYIRYRMADKQWAQTYFDVVLQPMEQQGIDFWWLDWQQEPTSEVVAGLSHTWWLNYTFFTDMERRGEKRPLLFHRWGGLGNHRYQIGFSGDDKIHWESLRYQTYFTPTASNVGYGYWSHDIGGHAASEWSQDPELYLRWLQFGVFSPILRTHSAKMSSVERRFWMYPDYVPHLREV
ncbi:MAG: TIM-barrel domain-containing protein, partial [Bacteroidota bacterium]